MATVSVVDRDHEDDNTGGSESEEIRTRFASTAHEWQCDRGVGIGVGIDDYNNPDDEDHSTVQMERYLYTKMDVDIDNTDSALSLLPTDQQPPNVHNNVVVVVEERERRKRTRARAPTIPPGPEPDLDSDPPAWDIEATGTTEDDPLIMIMSSMSSHHIKSTETIMSSHTTLHEEEEDQNDNGHATAPIIIQQDYSLEMDRYLCQRMDVLGSDSNHNSCNHTLPNHDHEEDESECTEKGPLHPTDDNHDIIAQPPPPPQQQKEPQEDCWYQEYMDQQDQNCWYQEYVYDGQYLSNSSIRSSTTPLITSTSHCSKNNNHGKRSDDDSTVEMELYLRKQMNCGLSLSSDPYYCATTTTKRPSMYDVDHHRSMTFANDGNTKCDDENDELSVVESPAGSMSMADQEYIYDGQFMSNSSAVLSSTTTSRCKSYDDHRHTQGKGGGDIKSIVGTSACDDSTVEMELYLRKQMDCGLSLSSDPYYYATTTTKRPSTLSSSSNAIIVHDVDHSMTSAKDNMKCEEENDLFVEEDLESLAGSKADQEYIYDGQYNSSVLSTTTSRSSRDYHRRKQGKCGKGCDDSTVEMELYLQKQMDCGLSLSSDPYYAITKWPSTVSSSSNAIIIMHDVGHSMTSTNDMKCEEEELSIEVVESVAGSMADQEYIYDGLYNLSLLSTTTSRSHRYHRQMKDRSGKESNGKSEDSTVEMELYLRKQMDCGLSFSSDPYYATTTTRPSTLSSAAIMYDVDHSMTSANMKHVDENELLWVEEDVESLAGSKADKELNCWYHEFIYDDLMKSSIISTSSCQRNNKSADDDSDDDNSSVAMDLYLRKRMDVNLSFDKYEDTDGTRPSLSNVMSYEVDHSIALSSSTSADWLKEQEEKGFQQATNIEGRIITAVDHLPSDVDVIEDPAIILETVESALLDSSSTLDRMADLNIASMTKLSAPQTPTAMSDSKFNGTPITALSTPTTMLPLNFVAPLPTTGSPSLELPIESCTSSRYPVQFTNNDQPPSIPIDVSHGELVIPKGIHKQGTNEDVYDSQNHFIEETKACDEDNHILEFDSPRNEVYELSTASMEAAQAALRAALAPSTDSIIFSASPASSRPLFDFSVVCSSQSCIPDESSSIPSLLLPESFECNLNHLGTTSRAAYPSNAISPSFFIDSDLNCLPLSSAPEVNEDEYEDDDEVYCDNSVYALEQRAQKIRIELRDAEMMQVAKEAERAAEAGFESFAGKLSTYGTGDSLLISLSKAASSLRNVSRNSFDMNLVSRAPSLEKPRRMRRRKTISEGVNVRVTEPSSKRLSFEPQKSVITTSLNVTELRDVHEVLPKFSSFHNHLRTHFARSQVDERTLALDEMSPPSAGSMRSNVSTNDFFSKRWGRPRSNDRNMYGTDLFHRQERTRDFFQSLSFDRWMKPTPSTDFDVAVTEEAGATNVLADHLVEENQRHVLNVFVPPGLEMPSLISRQVMSPPSPTKYDRRLNAPESPLAQAQEHPLRSTNSPESVRLPFFASTHSGASRIALFDDENLESDAERIHGRPLHVAYFQQPGPLRFLHRSKTSSFDPVRVAKSKSSTVFCSDATSQVSVRSIPTAISSASTSSPPSPSSPDSPPPQSEHSVFVTPARLKVILKSASHNYETDRNDLTEETLLMTPNSMVDTTTDRNNDHDHIESVLNVDSASSSLLIPLAVGPSYDEGMNPGRKDNSTHGKTNSFFSLASVSSVLATDVVDEILAMRSVGGLSAHGTGVSSQAPPVVVHAHDEFDFRSITSASSDIYEDLKAAVSTVLQRHSLTDDADDPIVLEEPLSCACLALSPVSSHGTPTPGSTRNSNRNNNNEGSSSSPNVKPSLIRRSSSANALFSLEKSPRGMGWNPFRRETSPGESEDGMSILNANDINKPLQRFKAMNLFSRIACKKKAMMVKKEENDDFLHNYLYCSKGGRTMMMDHQNPHLYPPPPPHHHYAERSRLQAVCENVGNEICCTNLFPDSSMLAFLNSRKASSSSSSAATAAVPASSLSAGPALSLSRDPTAADRTREFGAGSGGCSATKGWLDAMEMLDHLAGRSYSRPQLSVWNMSFQAPSLRKTEFYRPVEQRSDSNLPGVVEAEKTKEEEKEEDGLVEAASYLQHDQVASSSGFGDDVVLVHDLTIHDPSSDDHNDNGDDDDDDHDDLNSEEKNSDEPRSRSHHPHDTSKRSSKAFPAATSRHMLFFPSHRQRFGVGANLPHASVQQHQQQHTQSAMTNGLMTMEHHHYESHHYHHPHRRDYDYDDDNDDSNNTNMEVELSRVENQYTKMNPSAAVIIDHHHHHHHHSPLLLMTRSF